MSNRIQTATTPALLSSDHSEHKAKRSFVIAALALAALAANTVGAAASTNHRLSEISTPRSSWVSHYTPSVSGGDELGGSSRQCLRPSDGEGAYPDIFADVFYHRSGKC